jgi:hypothetical protein
MGCGLGKYVRFRGGYFFKAVWPDGLIASQISTNVSLFHICLARTFESGLVKVFWLISGLFETFVVFHFLSGLSGFFLTILTIFSEKSWFLPDVDEFAKIAHICKKKELHFFCTNIFKNKFWETWWNHSWDQSKYAIKSHCYNFSRANTRESRYFSGLLLDLINESSFFWVNMAYFESRSKF